MIRFIVTLSSSFDALSIRLGTYTGTVPSLLSETAPSQKESRESSFLSPGISDLILPLSERGCGRVELRPLFQAHQILLRLQQGGHGLFE